MKQSTLRFALPLLIAGAPGIALAQAVPAPGAAPDPAAQATPAPPEAPSAPATTDAPATADAPATTSEPSVDERLNELNGKMEGFQESYSATEAYVAAAKRLKFSGYLQGRYEWRDDGTWGVDYDPKTGAKGTIHGENRFLVRRGRLKATYQGDNSEYVLQIDAIPDGVTLRDAEASLIDTWTPLNIKLTVGQFKIPFGYEVLQSSSDREMPERSRMIRALFPGERDRGLRINASYQALRFSGAIINGTSFLPSGERAIYGTNDQSSYKDLVGRIGGDFELAPGLSWVIGASGYFGRELRTTEPRTALTPSADGTVPTSPTTATAPVSYSRYRRTRFGVDTQAYFDVPSVGGLALKAEFIWARDKGRDFQGRAADPCGVWDPTARSPGDGGGSNNGQGFYVTLVQNIGDRFGAVARYDQWDPNTEVEGGCTDVMKAMRYGEAFRIDRISTIGGGLLWYASGNAKLTFVYEHIMEQGSRKRDNDIFTAQLQTRF